MSLILNITTLKEYAPKVHTMASFSIFKSYIEEAENDYIIPAISQTYFDELAAKVSGAGVTANEKRALEKLQRSITYFALWLGADFMNLPVGNTGIKEIGGQEEQAPRQWVFNNFKASSLRKADKALDDALRFMETNRSDFATWTASDSFTVYKELFIQDADQYGKYRNIGGSRSTYQRLRSFIDLAEHRYLKIAMGDTLFDAMKSRLKAGTLTAEDDALMPYICRALANYALYEAIPELILDISTSGIRVVSHSDGITSKISASENKMGEYRRQVYGHGQSFLAELKKYLDDNISTYTEYESDDASENETPDYEIHDNTGSKSVMI